MIMLFRIYIMGILFFYILFKLLIYFGFIEDFDELTPFFKKVGTLLLIFTWPFFILYLFYSYFIKKQ